MTSTAAPAWKLVSARRLSLPRRWRNPIGIAGAVIVLLVVLTAILGPLLWTINPNAPVYRTLLGPSWAHPMGTDDLGRDTFARIIHGAQVSLWVGAVAVGIALGLGLLLGFAAGYYGRFVDLVIMRVIDVMFAIPGLILAFLIVGLTSPTRLHETIAIGIIITPAFVRVIRASVLEVKASPFIESARALGAGDLRVMRRHVFPNILAPLIVMASVYFSQAILVEATLSFLGLGVQPPQASWGGMLEIARGLVSESVWPAIFPGAAIMVTVLAFNFLGDGLRDVLDPRVATDIGAVAAERSTLPQSSVQ
jgi:peptide/nickel transport system permease protein